MASALRNMVLTVTLKDSDGPVEVTAINPDMLRYEAEAIRRGWGSAKDRPFTFMTFLAWTALKREGRYAGEWKAFSETDCLSVDSDDDDDDDDDMGEPVDPTQLDRDTDLP